MKTAQTNLLIAAAITTMALPIVLVLTEKLSGNPAILDSISAYYHSGSRDIFVGFLFAACAILFVFKSGDIKENIALNLAGFFGIVTALVPTKPPSEACAFACNNGFTPYCIHVIAALAFFVCLAYVAFFGFRKECKTICDQQVADKYQKLFTVLAVLLLLFPILAAVLSSGLFGFADGCSKFIFWAEFLAIYTLGCMWITKYFESKHEHEPL